MPLSATPASVPHELLDPVVAYFQPRRVILFGSMARGDAHVDSDIDLLVIVDDDAPPEQLSLKAGWQARQGYLPAADVIPVRQKTFDLRARVPGTLSYAARAEGIVVYERSSDAARGNALSLTRKLPDLT